MKPSAFLAAALAGAVAAACSGPADIAEDLGVSSSDEDKVAAKPAPQPHVTRIENDLYEFSYSWPAEARAIPALDKLLGARLAKEQAELEVQANAARQDAEESDFPYRPYFLSVEWKTVADLPDWLSLSSEIGTYTGGAHGNLGFASLLWDKQKDRPLQPLDLFTSVAALEKAVGTPFCEALGTQRLARRGEDYVPQGGMFDDCPALGELTVLLGSSNGGTFDRVGLLAAPYVAGPYAEGSYEVTVPVTDAVIGAVQEEFRPAFSAAR